MTHVKWPTSVATTVSFALRALALIAGVLQLIFGERGIGTLIILSVAAITVPQVATRGRVKSLPIEFELVFISMVILQLVIGETLDFYNNVPNYDKFVHFSLPFFIGLMSFTVAYTLHEIGSLSIPIVPLMFVIIFFTLGIGATWEIIEYTSDQYIDPLLPNISQLQGSLVESPHSDTMRDLVLDFFGGIFGAFLGLRYLHSTNKDVKSRVKVMVKELSTSLPKETK